MDLWQHIRTIWRYKLRIGLASIVIAGAVFLVSGTRPEVYAASVTMNVEPSRAVAGEAVTTDQVRLLVRSYTELVGTRTVLADAAEQSGLGISAGAVRDRVSVDPAGDTGYFDIEATGPSPDDAEALADAVAAVLQERLAERHADAVAAAVGPLERQIAELEARLAGLPEDSPTAAPLTARYETLLQAVAERELRPADRLEVVAPAAAGSAPVAPTPLRNALVALIVALVVNSELAVAWAYFGGRFSRRNLAEEVATATGLPVLAQVPAREGPQMVEAYRSLRTNLFFSTGTDRLRSLAVVGSAPGSGKSFTTFKLGQAVASGGVKVVLVDADLRRPTLHRIASLPMGRGLADARSHESLSEIVVPVPGEDNLWLLPAGQVPDDPSAAIGVRLHRILTEIDWAELLIFDTPAASLFADAAAVAAECDASLLVVDVRTSRRALRATMTSLGQIGARVLGVVANRVEVAERASAYDRYAPAADAGS
jgi:capsular exopolysaccharide synthesis family protein